MKLFIEKSRFRVGAGERKRLWWRTEQTIYLYYQKIIRIRIDILCLRQAQAPGLVVNIRRWLSGAEITGSMSENVPSTGSGTGSSNKYKKVIERSRNHRKRNKNVPSTGSGTGSSNKYKTVIEESRNHQMNKISLRQAQWPKRWLSLSKAHSYSSTGYFDSAQSPCYIITTLGAWAESKAHSYSSSLLIFNFPENLSF